MCALTVACASLVLEQTRVMRRQSKGKIGERRGTKGTRTGGRWAQCVVQR